MSIEHEAAKSRRIRSQYRLVLKALPVALLVLVLRYVVHNALDIQGIVSFSDAGAVITGATIIVGLMLAGVIADYKESEKLPAIVGGALTSLDSYSLAGLSAKDVDGSWVKARLLPMADTIRSWIYGRVPDEHMWVAQASVLPLVVEVDKAGAPSHYVGRLLTANADLASTLARIQTIRNTSFIRAGYVLMVLLVFIVLALLVIIDFTSPIMRWVVPGVLALAYTYLILLVRDIDNPFSGAACVDLTPVDEAVRSLRD